MIYEALKKIFGEVFTPIKLVTEMLDKLPVDVWTHKEYRWLDPACGTGNFLLIAFEKLMSGLEKEIPNKKERKLWILDNMLFGVDIQVKNAILTVMRLDPSPGESKIHKHIVCADSLNFDFWGLEFNVTTGNPPYAAPKERIKDTNSGTCGGVIWDKFVAKSLELTKENGYICLVHPAGWRRSNKRSSDVGTKILSRKIRYLELHSIDDGVKTFGVTTNYDWYVLQNCVADGTPTKIRDYSGKMRDIDLSGWRVIPNEQFGEVVKVLAKPGEETCEVLYSASAYETRKPYMSDTQQGEFQYPCVYSLPQKGIQLFYAKNKDNGHFGIPKVIFSNGAAAQVIVDEKGEYGLTQFAYGIVDSVENLPKIKMALESERFVELCRSMRFTLDKYNYHFIAALKKDFWKKFV